MITKTDVNDANIFVSHSKIVCFVFERLVMMKLVHTSCQKPHLHSKLVPNYYLFLCKLPLTPAIIFVHGRQSIYNRRFVWLLLVAAGAQGISRNRSVIGGSFWLAVRGGNYL